MTNNKERMWTLRKIVAGVILTDHTYQRDVNEKRVARIVKNFNPSLVNPPKVSFRDGHYYVFDGQHTLAALIAVYGRDKKIDCKVFAGITQKEEADLFIAQNGESANVKVIDRMKARYNIGERDAVRIVDGAKKAGAIVEFGHFTRKNGIVACAALENVYKALPYDEYISVVRILKEAWGGDPKGLTAAHINGLGYFIGVYTFKTINEKRLISVLSAVNPMSIVRDAKVSNLPSKVAVAKIYLRLYNKGKKKKLLDAL